MRVKLRDVTPILVGRKRVGVSGLDRAFALADEAEDTDHQRLVDLMLSELAKSNYLPPTALGDYRQAVWREYLRHRGEDIRQLYSEIEVVVRGDSGAEIDRFLEILEEVFAKFELKAVTAIEPPDPQGPNPQLLINNEVVVAGTTDSSRIAQAIGRQISDW